MQGIYVIFGVFFALITILAIVVMVSRAKVSDDSAFNNTSRDYKKLKEAYAAKEA